MATIKFVFKRDSEVHSLDYGIVRFAEDDYEYTVPDEIAEYVKGQLRLLGQYADSTSYDSAGNLVYRNGKILGPSVEPVAGV